MAVSVLDLVAGRQGHFLLESGHHGSLWLDLDLLFADPTRIQPLVHQLAHAIRRYDLDVVCGPLTGGGLLARMLATILNVEFACTERVVPPEASGLYQARYLLPPAARRRVHGQRVAVVDDVISAGSAVRATCTELAAHGGSVTVVGALLVLGPKALEYFEPRGTPLVAVTQHSYDMWLASECPLCRDGVPLENRG